MLQGRTLWLRLRTSSHAKDTHAPCIMYTRQKMVEGFFCLELFLDDSNVKWKLDPTLTLPHPLKWKCPLFFICFRNLDLSC